MIIDDAENIHRATPRFRPLDSRLVEISPARETNRLEVFSRFLLFNGRKRITRFTNAALRHRDQRAIFVGATRVARARDAGLKATKFASRFRIGATGVQGDMPDDVDPPEVVHTSRARYKDCHCGYCLKLRRAAKERARARATPTRT